MEISALLTHQKMEKSKRYLTVEPMLLVYKCTAVMSGTLFQNFLLFRTCDRYNFAELKCETELESQKEVSALISLETFTLYVLWIITMSCAGSLIDRDLKYLRLFLLFPAVGQVLCDSLNVLNSIYFGWSPFTSIVYTSILLGLSGSYVGAILMSTTYVSYLSTTENRSIRMGYVVLALTLGQGLGQVCGGYVNDYLGFKLGFLLCIVLNCLSVILGVIFIENPKKRDIHRENTGQKNYIKALVEGVGIMIKKRMHPKRTMIVLIVITYILNHCYRSGETICLYMFLRNKFGWEATQYGILMFYQTCIKATGTLLTTEILKRRLQLHDVTVGIIASICEIVNHSLWLTAAQTWQIYMIPLFGMFERVLESIALSLASECVEPVEYGRLSSLFALSRLFIPIATVLYSTLYQKTLRSYPTAIFLISTGLCVPMLFTFSILYVYTKRVLSSAVDSRATR